MQRSLAKTHWMAIILCAGALAIAPFAFAASSGQSIAPGASSLTASTANGEDGEALPSVKVRSFARTIEWWPYTTGPTYETLSRDDLISKRGIVLAVGGFTPDSPLSIPSELTGSLAGVSQGYAQYFLVKLSGEGEQLVANLAAIQTMGAVVMEQVPVNSMIVRLDKAAYDSVSSSPAINFIEPFHPAYRISPAIGKAELATAEAAASPILTLDLALFEGEPAGPVAQAASLLGANVLSATDANGHGVVRVAANAALIAQLSKLEAVKMIFEGLPTNLHAQRGAIFLQSRDDAAFVGDYKYWRAGVDGDNQVIEVQDSGLSVDAGDFADTRSVSGWTGSGSCQVVSNHRKVVCYEDSGIYGGSGGGGDLSACDSAVSGSFTHGQVVSGVAAGNATRDEVPAPSQPSIPGFGNGFYDDINSDGQFDELADEGFDGIAKGAKVVFVDAATGCPDALSPAVFPGNVETVIQTTWNSYEAKIHNNSWGSDAAPTGPVYNVTAERTDRAVFNNPINFVAFSAGNAGQFDDIPFDGGLVTAGTVGNEATCKNCVAVGASNGLGSHWSFTSKGPCGASSSGRVCPILFAEGFDNSCRSEDEGTEDQTGVATCFDSGLQTGTSFASPNMAGAAAVVQDFFQKGFYPDGTDQNATNSADLVNALSGHAVRAVLIASTIPITGGRNFMPPDRANNIWGYGQVVLSRGLPLSGDPETVSGLIVHDQPGEIDNNVGNGDEGVSDLDFAPTIAPGGTQTSIIEVLNDEEDLGIALTWLESESTSSAGSVINDLDLRLEKCSDAACTSVTNTWYGNIFSEDFDRDGNQDFDIPGAPDIALTGYAYSIDRLTVEAVNGSVPAGFKDPSNINEAIFIPRVDQPSIVDQNGDGNPDIAELEAGFYRVTVQHVSGAQSPLFAVAISGPVAAGSSVRLDTNPLVCNAEVAVIVSERADGADTACADKDTCPSSVISGRVTLRVKDSVGTVVDTETGIPFTQSASGSFQYESDRIPLTIFGTAADGDGVLTVNDTYSLEVEYGDVGATRLSQGRVDCSPQLGVSLIRQLGRDEAYILAGGCDGDRYLDQGENLSLELQYFNIDSIDLIDAELEIRAVLAEDPDSPGYDDDTDTCRVNNAPASFITIDNPVRTIGLLPAQFIQRAGFTFSVTGLPPQRQQVDLVVGLSGSKTGQQVQDCLPLTFLAQANDEINRFITDCPTGCTIDRDINNDEIIENRIARNPSDPIDFINRNIDESDVVYGDLTDTSFRTVDGDGDGTPDCPQCGNPGFNGPWDFNTNDENFRTGISANSAVAGATVTNWGEDENFNGVEDPGENKGSAGTLEQNWGSGGGCGWGSASGSSRGMWHTGTIGTWQTNHRTIACRPNDNICEQYDVQSGTAGEEFWAEFLRSPVVRPVRSGFDADGYEWKTQIVDWSWNMQIDTRDSDQAWTWEFDLNTEDGDPTLLGDEFITGDINGNANGLIAGGQLSLFGGGLAFLPTNQNDVSPNYGDELLSTKGNNRTGVARGCYFNDLDIIAGDGPGLTAADRQSALAKPFDDDCDNNFTYGVDGCPGLCGVDDDGDGAIDEQDETCPCKTCSGGPKNGQSCLTNANCRISATDTALCTDNTDTAGDPAGFGDDECGTAAATPAGQANATDEFVADFGGVPTVRQYRNADMSLVNGIAGGGRGGGDPRFNALEDFYGPPGQSWATEIGFLVYEGEGTTAPIPGYGIGLDDMVIEWQETHPVGQTANACSAANEDYRDQCARVGLGVAFNTFDGDGEIPVAVIDFNAAGSENEVDCNGDGTAAEVEVFGYSEAEPNFETYCLEPAAPGSTEYVGTIKTTTRIKKGGDGLVYLAWNGSDTPSVTALYIDKETDLVGYGPGPDGQPGIAGYDDDGDGVVDDADELCPLASTLGPGRSPHRAGQPARYSDDECGCPDNPVLDSTFTAFDPIDIVVTDWDVDDSSCAGCDNDGWPDPGEKVFLSLTLRNFSNFPIENVELILSSDSPLVDCVTDDRATIARIEAQDPDVTGDIVTLAADAFEFIAADGVDRSSTNEEFSSTWTLALRGLGKADGTSSLSDDVPISGSFVVQSFKIPHNLDAPSTTPAANFTENFESYSSDATLRNAWVPYVTGDDAAELDGTRCQTNDPANPFGNNTDPADFCQLGEGYDNLEEHWHLHGPGPGKCESICPDNGRSMPGGAQSLANGNIPDGGGGSFVNDGITMDQNRMNWAQYQSNFQLGLGEPELDLWTQMSITDSRLFGSGAGWAFDAAGVYVCVDSNNNDECDTGQVGTPDNGEIWEIVRPYFAPSQGFRQNNFINCMYDPSDDGTTEDQFFPNDDDTGPSSTCFPGNPVDTCVGRTMAEGFGFGVVPNSLLSICFPETGNEAEEISSGAAVQDAAGYTWVNRKYRLDKWRGQKILLRFHHSPGGLPGIENAYSILAQGAGNRDDGWFIDDIVMSGLANDFTLSVDNAGTPNDECATVAACTTIDGNLAVLPYPRVDRRGNPRPANACSSPTLDNCDFDNDGALDTSNTTGASNAAGRPFVLDARFTSAPTCLGGALEFRFLDVTNSKVIRDWLTDTEVLVNPVATTTYSVEVRCSSDTSCNTSTQLTITVPGGSCDTSDLLIATNKSTITWQQSSNNACPAIFDTSKSSSASSGYTCLENNGADLTSTDGATPAAGSAFFYLTRADGESWTAAGPGELADRDTRVNTCN